MKQIIPYNTQVSCLFFLSILLINLMKQIICAASYFADFSTKENKRKKRGMHCLTG